MCSTTVPAASLAFSATRSMPRRVRRRRPGTPRCSRPPTRYALRHFQRPDELAASPLAVGSTPSLRSESVRTLLRDAIDEVFGSTAEEQLLRAVLIQGCLEPTTTHERTADQLHVSRATYFRKLRTATARLSTYIAQQQVKGG